MRCRSMPVGEHDFKICTQYGLDNPTLRQSGGILSNPVLFCRVQVQF